MNKKNNKLTIIIFIILIVSVGFIAAKFGNVAASDSNPTKPAIIQESNNKPSAVTHARADTESIVPALLKLLGALIIVVIGIYGFLYMLRKMMGSKFSGNKQHSLLEVLETTYVAQKKSVSLVRFSDRAVLIGIGENNISVLAELTSEETAKILTAPQDEAARVVNFRNFLSDARTKLMGINLKGVRILSSSKNADTQAA